MLDLRHLQVHLRCAVTVCEVVLVLLFLNLTFQCVILKALKKNYGMSSAMQL